MQIGAVRAILEAGYKPDLVTGTSIGAVNGAFLAVNGFTPEGIEQATLVWKVMAGKDLMPMNKWWETARALITRSEGISQERIRGFATSHGLAQDIKFRDLKDVMLYLVAADMNTGHPIVFGVDSEESILDSMFASMALPPWVAPYEQADHFLVDGGLVSNLPIEAALNMGATEIIALDLFDPTEQDQTLQGIPDLISKLTYTLINRQLQLELHLAEASGVPVKHIVLVADPQVPIWDFRRTEELIEHGYILTRSALSEWSPLGEPSWWSKLRDKAGLRNFFS